MTYNILEKSTRSKSFNFRHFGVNWRPEEFMAAHWKDAAFRNYGILQKVVDLFVQASTPGVDERTKMLIRYNIIEICMGKFKIKNEEFIFKSEPNKVFNKALDVLLENVSDADKKAFTDKWSASVAKLKFKPMKSPMNEFLQSKKIPIASLPIKLGNIISLRNSIIHGSLDIDILFLKDVNILLYRITGILILDLIGITEAKMNLSLPSRG